MKKCYGNYMEYPVCLGHNDCKEEGCRSKTNKEKGACDCIYKASCHMPRQRLQVKFRSQEKDYKMQDCPFYVIFNEMYGEKNSIED